MAHNRDGRFSDRELDRLLVAMSDAGTRVGYFEALFGELVAGARDADDDDERERYGQQALVVSCALAATRASQDVDELTRTLLARATETQGDRRAQIEAATDRGVAEIVDAVRALTPESCEQRFDELGERIAMLEAVIARFVEHACDGGGAAT